MIRATRLMRTILVLAALMFVVAPSAVFAVTRTVTQVTGAEIAAQVAGQLKGIAVGSDSATVTVAVDGSPTDVRVDFVEAVGALERGDGPSWLKVAFLPLAAGALLRLLTFLARLGRG
jgi:hypothetical protein